MRVGLCGFALVLALGPRVGAEVTVRATAGRVDITANAAPLADVLDRLARQTGMKVVYEGPAPRQLVTVSLLGRSPAEAVHDLLEGQGLNYALLGDSAGTGVQTLLMTGQASAVASASGASGAPTLRARTGPPPMSSPDSVEEPEEEPDEEPTPEGTPAPGAANAIIESLAGGTMPGGAPIGAPPGVANPFIPIPTPTTPANQGAATPPVQTAPAIPRTMPPGVNPGFMPVNPLSPLGPFAPVIPSTPGSPTGTPGSPTGTPGSPTESPEPREPPF